jgi:CBS domain-containing protein
MYQVKDAMSHRILTISPEATVHDAIELLLDRDVSGVPVVSGKGELVGMITQFQLMEVLFDPEIEEKRVSDFMTKRLITVGEDEMLARAASLMVTNRIRRLPVLRNGRLCGVVSRGDLLRYFRRSSESIAELFQNLRNVTEQEASTATV